MNYIVLHTSLRSLARRTEEQRCRELSADRLAHHANGSRQLRRCEVGWGWRFGIGGNKKTQQADMLNSLATVARARSMVKLAESTGMSKSGLYKALSANGNPSFAMVGKIAGAMGYRVALLPNVPAAARDKAPTKKRKPATKKRKAAPLAKAT